MTALTPEQRAYKEKTVTQLAKNFSHIERQLEHEQGEQREQRPDVIDELHEQLEAIQAHLLLLQKELAANEAGEPVADNLYRRIATALTTGKFLLARKLIYKLETIEPYYPDIERLKTDAEAGRASRRTQSISRGGSLPEIIVPSSNLADALTGEPGQPPEIVDVVAGEPPKQGLAQLFQFHIVASCLVVSLIACVMFGMGGMSALQWLVEGN